MKGNRSMNEIKLTVELCPEDRARLDKIIELLGHRPDCSACVASVADTMDRAGKVLDKKDDITKMAESVLARTADPAEPAKNAQEEPKASDHPTLDPFPERPEAVEEPSKATEETEEETVVTMAMLRNKAITLAAAGKTAKVREVVHPFAPKVTELPEDKWAVVYKNLCALEG
jgi:hypothetical protein